MEVIFDGVADHPHSCRQLGLSPFSDPSIRFTTGANTFTLQNLTCHPRFRRESDAVYRAAVSDRSISAYPQLRMRWSRGIPKVEIGYELRSDRFGVDAPDNRSDHRGDCKARNREGNIV